MAFAAAKCPNARALGVHFAPKSPAEGGDPDFKCEVRFGRFVDPNLVYGNILETIKRPIGIPSGGGTLEFRFFITAGATLAGVANQAERLQGFVKENTVTYGAASVSLRVRDRATSRFEWRLMAFNLYVLEVLLSQGISFRILWFGSGE